MHIMRHEFTTIASTSRWAKEHAASCDRKSLHVITAHMQTAGKGRDGRTWFSPGEKNVYATFLFFIDRTQKDVGHLSQLMSLVAVQTLNALGFSPLLKWPNDLMLGGKKLGGILTEIFQPHDSPSDELAVAIGIGINVNMSLDSLNHIPIPATSLAVESGSPLAVEDLLEPLIANFAQALEHFMAGGFLPFLPAYRQNIAHRRGDNISFHYQKQILTGKFLEIGIAGTLCLQLENGEIRALSAGEILNECKE